MANILIIGAGVAGCTSAYLLSKKGHHVTVLEGAPHPGGGVWTQWYGGHPYTFGPRIFFTKDEEVISTINSLTKIRQFYTRTWTYVAQDGNLYHYPITMSDLPQMPDWEKIKKELDERMNKTPRIDNFENYWIDAIGPTLYGKFVNQYSKKMWGIESNKALSANFEWVNRGTPIRQEDTRLYCDQFQGYPDDPNGYNSFFENALAGSKVIYNCRVGTFNSETMTLSTSKGEFKSDVIINTGHVDDLFSHVYGSLLWCGRKFLKIVLPCENVFPEDVTWIHYSGQEEYTRVTEFKKITGHQAKDTLIGVELPDPAGRYYPVQIEVELLRFKKYQAMFPKNFYSIGRLGSYRYKGIPDAIRDALDVTKAIG
jgi:UDP-galactopyranose mutase